MQEVEEFRQHLLDFATNVPKENAPLKDMEDINISYGDRAFPCRMYIPHNEAQTVKQPLLLYTHGAGFIGGNLDTHDNACRYLAAHVPCMVLASDYHRPPEARFPAAPEDCYAALSWVSENMDRFQYDRKRLAIAGDSAGGNLTAVLAQMVRDRNGPRILFQLLINPLLDMTDALGYEWFRDTYLSNPEDQTNPYASPMHAQDLSHLPDAFILTSENDSLCSSGERYAERLRAAGVFANTYRLKGLGHLGMEFAAATEVARQALELSVVVLRAVLY
jgi:acetyl esterase